MADGGWDGLMKLKRFAPTLALASAIAYLGYHALEGDQGLYSYWLTQSRIAETQAELALAQAERRDLEDRVARLSPDQGALDLDYVEERAREVLNFAHPDEIIIKIEPERVRY